SSAALRSPTSGSDHSRPSGPSADDAPDGPLGRLAIRLRSEAMQIAAEEHITPTIQLLVPCEVRDHCPAQPGILRRRREIDRLRPKGEGEKRLAAVFTRQ